MESELILIGFLIFICLVMLFLTNAKIRLKSKKWQNIENTNMMGTKSNISPIIKNCEIIVNHINDVAFNGFGNITIINDNNIKLSDNDRFNDISFILSNNNLTIKWSLIYLIKEVIHERSFNFNENLDYSEQLEIADIMIQELNKESKWKV
jgi:hypothetical protein